MPLNLKASEIGKEVTETATNDPNIIYAMKEDHSGVTVKNFSDTVAL